MAEQLISHCLADLTYPDIQAYLKRSELILIPIASTEQHGPHLPLSTDTVTAYEVSKRAAEQADVLYTPTIWTGYSPQHMRAPSQGAGTITVRAETLLNLVYDIARSLIHHGFNKLIFVNGHGSNVKVIDPVLRRIRYDTGALVAF
jgi:creatinine amidohydrolase